jgi:hypothetical protein
MEQVLKEKDLKQEDNLENAKIQNLKNIQDNKAKD